MKTKFGPDLKPAGSQSFAIFGLLGVVLLGASAARAASVADLRCEYRAAPLGIDAVKPRLSWVNCSTEPGAIQTAYQVLVASSPEVLARNQGDRWDSGKVLSQQQNQIEYAGRPLESRAVCCWKVRIWDQDGKPGAWSQPNAWTMGLLSPADWQAQWIGNDSAYDLTPEAAADDKLLNIKGLKWIQMPEKEGKKGGDTFIRRNFDLPTDRLLKRATLALYAFNECEASLNGAWVGHAEHWEATARIDLSKTIKPGVNLLGLQVRHTDPYLPAAIGRLVLQFETGENVIIPMDERCKVSQTQAPQWNAVGFDDQTWLPAQCRGNPWGANAPKADLPRMPVPYLRKEFTISREIKRATVYVTALGVYELRLNGKRVGHDVLAPGWTEFRNRVHYQTYDVSGLVAQGNNAIGAVLGDGWYASTLAHIHQRNLYGGRPRFLVQLELELADGTIQRVCSDPGWKTSFGPLRHADLLMGCEYDAQLAMPGWDQPGFDDRAWGAVIQGGSDSQVGVNRVVQASVAEPSRVLEQLPAMALSEPRPKQWVFDLGQNMVGWARLKVKGAAGTRITVRHAEMLNADGTLYTAALRSCPATDFYRLSGKGEETFEPFGTFHGFRYVEIRGLEAKPELSAVTGLVVHTPMERTGSFECSNPLLNQLYRNLVWGQKGNYLEVPTDCPQRDERMGWTGDTQFFAPTAAYNFNVANFFTRWLQTCRDDQNANGSFPPVIPGIYGGDGATAWSDAPILCTYNIYRNYGDTRLIAEQYASMERYMNWLEGKTKDGITTVGGFGDWLNAGGGAKKEVIDTAYHAYLSQIMAEMAQAIGQTGDAVGYTQRAAEIKKAFAREFIQPDGAIKESSQTAYALAFTMDLLPAEMREKAADQFVQQIKRFKDHLATGFIGTPRLLPALSQAGRSATAYQLLLTETYPSWLFPVKNGATTMWERWNGWTPDRGFGSIGMNSFNHYAFGAVGEYLYGYVGGIQPASPGYKTITIRPVLGAGVSWAKTGFHSPYGLIATAWKVQGSNLQLDVTIPPNTTATLYVPAENAASVTLGSKIKFLRQEAGAAVYEAGAGTYQFLSVIPNPIK